MNKGLESYAMASSMRFERTTYCLGGSRSIQLSYEDVGNHEWYIREYILDHHI